MLVIHWTKHNLTTRILRQGLHRVRSHRREGVFVFPYSPHSTLNKNWRAILKAGKQRRGDYNGFIFRLMPSDFPVLFGIWPAGQTVYTLKELTNIFGGMLSGKPVSKADWAEFEIIVPKKIHHSRIIRVVSERPPRKVRREPVNLRTGAHELDVEKAK